MGKIAHSQERDASGNGTRNSISKSPFNTGVVHKIMGLDLASKE